MLILDKLISIQLFEPVFSWLYDLSEKEVMIIVALTVLLFLVLTFRTFGIPATFLFAVLFFIIYIIWQNNTLSLMEEQGQETDKRIQQYEDELDKFNR